MTDAEAGLQGPDVGRQELTTRLRKLDQNISAHSHLRDQFSRRSTILGFVLIISSTIVTIFAVASDRIKALLLPGWLEPDLVISLCGVVVLLGTIAELALGWKEGGAAHAEAARALARLKLLFTHELSKPGQIPLAKFAELRQSYEDLHDLVAKIPESKFLKLKAAHQRKVVLSKMISASPGASLWLLRIKLWIRENSRPAPKA